MISPEKFGIVKNLEANFYLPVGLCTEGCYIFLYSSGEYVSRESSGDLLPLLKADRDWKICSSDIKLRPVKSISNLKQDEPMTINTQQSSYIVTNMPRGRKAVPNTERH
jgi:hypothetical protein